MANNGGSRMRYNETLKYSSGLVLCVFEKKSTVQFEFNLIPSSLDYKYIFLYTHTYIPSILSPRTIALPLLCTCAQDKRSSH